MGETTDQLRFKLMRAKENLRTATSMARELLKFGCPHDGEFLFFCDSGRDERGWLCAHGCGFWINFDPDIATVNNRGEDWRERGVSYHTSPLVPGKRISIDYTAGEL